MSKKPKPELLDSDNPEWTAKDFAKARPAREVLPEIFGQQMAKDLLRPRGRPRVEFPKERINIRLSQEVIQHFKSAGKGWQTRIDIALQQFIADRSKTR